MKHIVIELTAEAFNRVGLYVDREHDPNFRAAMALLGEFVGADVEQTEKATENVTYEIEDSDVAEFMELANAARGIVSYEL